MQQREFDNWIILALLLTFVGDFIALFLETKNQQQKREDDKKQAQSDKNIKAEFARLQHEIDLLKLEIKKTTN